MLARWLDAGIRWAERPIYTVKILYHVLHIYYDLGVNILWFGSRLIIFLSNFWLFVCCFMSWFVQLTHVCPRNFCLDPWVAKVSTKFGKSRTEWTSDQIIIDWWFGTWFFHILIYWEILGIIIPTDEGVGIPPTRLNVVVKTVKQEKLDILTCAPVLSSWLWLCAILLHRTNLRKGVKP